MVALTIRVFELGLSVGPLHTCTRVDRRALTYLSQSARLRVSWPRPTLPTRPARTAIYTCPLQTLPRDTGKVG